MRILFVCLGNICRSPLAEGIMRSLCISNRLHWEVASAGTGSWHVGNPPDRRSIAVAKAAGYDIEAQRARHFQTSDFNTYDLILTMDASVYQAVLRLASSDEHRQKVSLFLDAGDVIDPYYDDALFEQVCKQIESRCQQLITMLKG